MASENVIAKPWGQEELLELNERYCLKRLTMKKGHSCSLQAHLDKRETVYILSGTLKLVIGYDKDLLTEKTLHPQESLTIHPNQIHRMTALEDSVYLEASDPFLDDVVRIKDDYGRV